MTTWRSSSSSPAAASTSTPAPGTAATPPTSPATTATRSSPSYFPELSPQENRDCPCFWKIGTVPIFLEVAAQGVERGERRDPCRLGAQHARAEARRHEAGVGEPCALLGAEARLGPRRDGEVFAGLARLGKAQLGVRREQDARAGAVGPIVRGGDERTHRRYAIAAALLAGGDGDLLPVRLARGGALALRSRHRRGCKHGMDLGGAEFDRLADREVHAFTRGDALYEDHAKRRFALERAVLENIDEQLQPLGRGDARGIFAAAAVEQRDVVAGADA